MSAITKTYFANIHSPTISGTSSSGIISTVKDFVFTGFSWAINGGLGATSLRFSRKFNSFGEGSDIAAYNEVDIYINDKESGPNGTLIYSGYISDYTPTLDGIDEYVDVTVWGYPTEFNVKILEDGTNTSLSYSNQDPSAILKDAINRYDGHVSYNSSSIDLTNTSTSYNFKQNTIQEVVDACLNMAPAYWYWRIGADNVLNFHLRNTNQIDHILYIGKDISSIKATRSIQSLNNGYYFLGGPTSSPVYVKSIRSGSQSTYGKRSGRQQDERVQDNTTATTIAHAYLDFYDHPQIVITVTVVDSNGDGSGGYDIELFKPGQIVKLVDPLGTGSVTLWDVAKWDIDSWDYPITSVIGVPLQIRSIDYSLEQATLQLSYDTEDFATYIQDITNSLVATRTANTPTTPTTV